MTVAIEATDLTKRYGDFTAVDRLNLPIEEGEIFGFLGPNGAGKTTSILMWLGLTSPTSGTARIRGYNCTREPLKVKAITGYLPENLGFYGDLSAEENLLYTTRLNSIPRREAPGRIDTVLTQVGLASVARQPVRQFSRGMRQRLGIADVLVKRPQVVFLDEPTQGIDVAGVQEFLEIITGMSREQGITVLLSSHQLHQVQHICDRVGIMSRGRLVALGTVDKLGQELDEGSGTMVELEVESPNHGLQEALAAVPGVQEVEVEGNTLAVRCQEDARSQLAAVVYHHGVSLLSMRTRDVGLEEIYLRHFQEAIE